MGQAKQRGTRDERVQQAVERKMQQRPHTYTQKPKSLALGVVLGIMAGIAEEERKHAKDVL